VEYRTLGRTGVEVSPICLGSDDFGDATPPEVAEKIIVRALDAGINLIDTGNLCAEGESEKIIGKTLKENNLRHSVIISTKVDHAPRKKGVSLDEFAPQMAPNTQGNSRLNIIKACKLSLRDLQTDYIDIFMIHRYYPEYHIEETLGALTDLVGQGKVRYIGCSTFPPWKVMHALMLSQMKN
jgi:aryl-alcohol dehydrogenase-like predicted oxidoreductase